MVVWRDPPDFSAATREGISKANGATMRTTGQLPIHNSSRGSEQGDCYPCTAGERALVGSGLAQAQHRAILQARRRAAPELSLTRLLDLRCSTRHRSRKIPRLAWVLREATLGKVEPKKDRGAQLLMDSQRVLLARIVLATFSESWHPIARATR